MRNTPLTKLACALGLTGMAHIAEAADVQVEVTGLEHDRGKVGCALHTSASTFPMDPNGVTSVWVSAADKRAVCVFRDVAAGTYAVAVSHDLNSNRQTDTNLLGMPTEAWGVSNNIRPIMRAPRFKEAAFQVASNPVVLKVELDR